MKKMIVVDAAEPAACPKCSHVFPLSDGLSRQTIERYAADFERSFAERGKALEAELAAEAKRRAERAAREQYETEVKAMKEARRMLDPGHPTKVPTLDRALAALGRRAEVAVG